MTDSNAGYVSFRKLAKDILMDRAKRLAKERGQAQFPGLPAYLMEASEFFERKRDV